MNQSEIERLAEQVHRSYLKDRIDEDTFDPGLPTHGPWDTLSAQHRQQNFDQVRQYEELLTKVGLRFDSVSSADESSPTSFDPAELEQLAEIEHERWYRLRYQQGWRYGRERNDTSTPPRHPDLVPWEELDEPTREKDRAPIRRLPSLATLAGLRLVRDEDGAVSAEPEE